MKFLIPFDLLLCVIVLESVSGIIFEECANIPGAAFIGGTKGCQSYIYCDGDDSYEGFCPSALMFNTKDGSCAPAADVDCEDDILPATTTITKATTTTTTTTTLRPTTTTIAPTTTTTTTKLPLTTVAEIITTTDKEDEPEEDTTDMEIVTNIHTTTTSTSSKVSSSTAAWISTTGSQGSVTSKPLQNCPAIDKVDEVIFLPSEQSCSEYFVCYHGTPVSMYCSGHLYFDYVTSKCDLPERVSCKIGSLTTMNPKKKCTPNTFDYFSYPKNCNYFYKCINGFLSLQQCPIGFGWSEDMKLCLKLNQGKCPTGTLQHQLSQAWFNSGYLV